jgi:hypothetical protein
VPDFRRTFHHPEVRVLGGLGRVSGVRRVHVSRRRISGVISVMSELATCVES